MRLPAGYILLTALLAAVSTALLCASTAHAAPPQFGVEIEAGTAAGFTSYLRNEVVTEVDRTQTDEQGRFLLEPSLVDVETGAGTSLGLRLIASNIAAGLSLRWFDLTANELHHVGRRSISPDRVRPDGSVDDSGVDYRALDPSIDQPIRDEQQDQLYVVGLNGDYRFIWPGDGFDVFVPVGGAAVVTFVTRDASPIRLGLEASSGLGMTITVSDTVALALSGRVHGLVTSHYGRSADAARRAVSIGETTEEAFFSTLLYGSANIAVQFRIR
ncbi:hypothetical protein FIV42_27860 [Persicimonas caeni]|uniref:Uncharacterized protein n=1 Tax=Persicimonas caeni TaxID=2292766 RepID=A0A4Y6Q1M2_PERCE|nr:hypothetical protein [Persicimonas caeni]QDG54422.1 hypothetical protein FIV42_27860 [Persicimonas caeni]QED35643.1 hypothetical protein FRD00_27855 [Persicimonas caeni]